jgi:Domain of unknown function (DUF1830)
MSHILDPLPQNLTSQFLCSYLNPTSKIQVVRITNVPNWYFERVVFPAQTLLFEVMPGAVLEVHSGMMASSILSDRIACEQLAVAWDGALPGHDRADAPDSTMAIA